MLNALFIAALTQASAAAAPPSFVEKIPGTLAEFKMVKLPDGKISLGGKEYEIKNLSIGETEVTWDVFDIFYMRLDIKDPKEAENIDARSRPSKPYGAPDRGYGHAGYPALSMTFAGAGKFCEWLSQKTGKRYRLPTEAEWEYAARAGAEKEPENIGDFAWFWDNAEDKTQPVAKKKPNAFGLYDMIGNAGEWVRGADNKWYQAGGTFKDKREKVGFNARESQTPAWNQTDPQNPKSRWWLSDGYFVGFRVVCEG